MSTPAPTALAEPATAAALPRPARWVRVAALVGVLCLAGWFLADRAVGAANDDLRAHGVRVTGTVERVETGVRGSSDSVVVRFRDGGAARSATVSVGITGPDHEPGDRVTVFYDPQDPARVTIDDVDSSAGVHGGWPYITELLRWLGIGVVLTAVLGWVRDRRSRARLRAALASGPWAPGPVRVGFTDDDPRFRDLDEHATVLTTPDGTAWVRETTWPDGPGPWAAPPPPWTTGVGWTGVAEVREVEAWWVADGDTAVFSPDRGAPLLLARRRG